MQRISVITVNFNNSEGLWKTMGSVCSQDYKSVEYIVIDGASTDGSKDAILRFSDKIAYWVSEPDRGIYDAMNKALLHATGDYVLFLNSGDYFCSSHVLSKVFHDVQTKDLLVGRQRFVQKNKECGISPLLHVNEINMEYFLSSTLPHQSTFIKKSLFDVCGPYDTSYLVCADWVFWIEAVVRHHCTIGILSGAISYMEEGGVSSDMSKCHKDMSRYLQACLDRNIISWNMILSVAQKARTQDLCNRSQWLSFANRILSWIGRRI